MAYNDFTGIKKINSIPADLRYFEKVAENDLFFKEVVDLDEDLEALDRDIIPTVTNTYKIGSSTNLFSEVNTSTLIADNINLASGSIGTPSLRIGIAGLSSLASDQISFISSTGLEPLRLMTSGALIKAANSTQLKIENTLPGSLAEWAIGSDSTGFSFTNLETNEVKLKIKNDELSIINKINLPNGSAISPSIYFGSDMATGFYKDGSLPILNFSVSGASKLSISSDNVQVLSNKLVVPAGTEEQPSIVFSGMLATGFFGINAETLGISFDGQMIHKFFKEGSITEVENVVSLNQKRVYAGPSSLSWHVDSFGRANGTKLIPTPVLQDEELYAHSVDGFTDTGWQRVTEILATASEDYTSGTYGSKLAFSIIRNGTSNLVEVLNLGNPLNSIVHVPLSFGINKNLHSTSGLAQEINVSGKSKLMIDATSGNIEIKGFTGGKEGQILYVYKKVPTNTLTLLFNNGTATQKILLKGSTNYVNTNDYGGITLSFDDGVWREVSRS